MTDEPQSGLDPRPDDDWEARLTKQVVRTIARYKEALGLTTPQLAERYSAAVGEPGALKPTTLNNLLAGKRRSIGFAEIIAFALALGVPPLALMVPLFEAGEVEAYPLERMLPFGLHSALVGTGDQPADGNDAYSEPLRTWGALRALLHCYSEQTLLYASLWDLAESALPAAAVERRRMSVIQRAIHLQAVREGLEGLGVTLPPLPPVLAWIGRLQPSELTPDVLDELARTSAEAQRDASA